MPVVLLPQEWLARHLNDLPALEADLSNPWQMLPRCKEKIKAPAAVARLDKVAERLRITLHIVPSGGCGMADLYGYEPANRATSKRSTA